MRVGGGPVAVVRDLSPGPSPSRARLRTRLCQCKERGAWSRGLVASREVGDEGFNFQRPIRAPEWNLIVFSRNVHHWRVPERSGLPRSRGAQSPPAWHQPGAPLDYTLPRYAREHA